MVSWAHPSHIPNGILIGSADFAGLMIVTDQQITLLHLPQQAIYT